MGEGFRHHRTVDCESFYRPVSSPLPLILVFSIQEAQLTRKGLAGSKSRLLWWLHKTILSFGII